MAIEAHIVDQMKQELNGAPYGQRTQVVKKFSELAGCSKKTIYGYLSAGKKRIPSGHKIEGIEEYAMLIHQIKKKAPGQFGEISTDQAIKIAVQSGIVPADLNVSVSTINRIARDKGLHRKKRRIQRYQAVRPNQMHHVDASSSKFFYIHRKLSDGDYVLKIHVGIKGYKNKPVPIHLRPWVYGVVDDLSGVFTAWYVAAYGESILDNLNFLCWAWSQTPDKTFFGIPELLKGDRGPMMRGKYAQEFFDRLDIDIDPSSPENKESHGKIERPWRTVWQRFEKPFFACSDLKKFEITLSELNQQFLNFQKEYNDMPHRYEKDVSRLSVWKRISLSGGAVAMPEHAISTIISRTERTVGTDGCFSIDNVIYEVIGLHDAKVWVYQGIFNDKMVVEDQATGFKYDVENFKPNKIGEFTGHQETPHQKAVKASKDMELSHNLYSESKDPGNVVQIPTRIKETRTISDPLDTDAYPSMIAAMHGFISISGYVPDKEDREIIEQLILENGFSRQFVRNLAFDAQAESNRSLKYV